MEFLFLAGGLALLAALGFANGANDVSKAVASLAGAGIASLRGAVLWGTVWTAAGGLAGTYWGLALVENLSSSVYAETVPGATSLPMMLAVGAATILWVGLATWRGWPVSTTHAVVGGLVGAGLAAWGGDGIAWGAVGTNILLPLIASPVMAIALAFLFRPAIGRLFGRLGRYKLCLAPYPQLATVTVAAQGTFAARTVEPCTVCAEDSPAAAAQFGIRLSEDGLHWLTSGLLSFARGLNDAPKLIAVSLPVVMLGGGALNGWLFAVAAVAMGMGGLIAGRRVTEVLGYRITAMDHHQGFAANLTAAALVIGASRFGLPVSTTHVAASAIVGVGVGGGSGLRMATVRNMLMAWLVTAPAAALFAAVVYGLLAPTLG